MYYNNDVDTIADDHISSTVATSQHDCSELHDNNYCVQTLLDLHHSYDSACMLRVIPQSMTSIVWVVFHIILATICIIVCTRPLKMVTDFLSKRVTLPDPHAEGHYIVEGRSCSNL